MRSSRIVVIVAMLGVATPLVVARAQAPMAWSYTINIKTDSGNGHPPTSIAMRHQTSERYLRTEMVQISGMPDVASAEGSYTLLDSVDSTLMQVLPSQRRATVMALGSILGNAATMRMTMRKATKTVIEDLGPGGRLLGHDTHHYRMTTTGGIEMTQMGKTCVLPADGVTDSWVAPDIDLRPAAEALLKHYGAAAPVPETSGEVSGAMTTMPKGAALRSISRQTRQDAQGASQTITTTMEYSDISHGPVNPAVFAVPSDYKMMDMRKMMAHLPAGMMDSAMAANAAKPTAGICGQIR